MSAGLVILQFLRETNFEPDVFFSALAGYLSAHDVPVHRARLYFSVEDLTREDHALSATTRSRLASFLRRYAPTHVLSNTIFVKGVRDDLRDILPGITLTESNEAGLDVVPSALLRAIVENEPLELAGSDEAYREFLEYLDAGGRLAVSAENLTPERSPWGYDGDLLIGYFCVYRRRVDGAELPQLVGERGCTFCQKGLRAKGALQPSLKRIGTQLGTYLETSPQARHFQVIDAGFAGHCVAFAREVVKQPWRGLHFFLDLRIPDFLRYRERFEKALALLAEGSHVLHISCFGFETFSLREFKRLNKGYPLINNVQAIIELRELKKRFPEAFDYALFSAHGFIMFTPWTTVEDIRLNLFYIHALDFPEFCPRFFLRKLRLYPQLPLYKLARADGLLRSDYEDDRETSSQWQGYALEVPWKFVDAVVAAIYRWTLALFLPPRNPIEATRQRRFRERLQDEYPDNPYRETIGFAAVVRACLVLQTADNRSAMLESTSGSSPEETLVADHRGAGTQSTGIRPEAPNLSAASDTLIFERILESVSLPVAELFPPIGHPLDRDRFPALSPTDDRSFYRREWALARSPVTRLESYPEDELAAIEAEAEADGLVTRRLSTDLPANLEGWGKIVAQTASEATILLVAKEAADLDEAYRLLREGESLRQDPGTAMGRLLGYPDCCVEHYGADQAASKDDLRALARSVGATRGVCSVLLHPFHPQRKIEYFPCRLDCPESLRRIAALEGRSSVEDLATVRADPVLQLSPLAFLELHGAVPEENGFTYQGVDLRGEDSWGRELLLRLREGTRLLIFPRILLVFRDWDLLHTIPNQGIIPVPLGFPVNFPWLTEAGAEGYRRTSDDEKERPHTDEASPEFLRELEVLLQQYLEEGLPEEWVATDMRRSGGELVLEVSRAGKSVQLRLTSLQECRDATFMSYGYGVTIREKQEATVTRELETLCRDLVTFLKRHERPPAASAAVAPPDSADNGGDGPVTETLLRAYWPDFPYMGQGWTFQSLDRRGEDRVVVSAAKNGVIVQVQLKPVASGERSFARRGAWLASYWLPGEALPLEEVDFVVRAVLEAVAGKGTAD
jgi:hypothetical protein